MEGIQPRYHIERYTRYHIERYKWYHIDRYERYHLSAILRKVLNIHKGGLRNTLITNNSYLEVSVLLSGAFLQDTKTVANFAPANKKLVIAKQYYYERD